MPLQNDPRFFNDNVLDKRLASFTALSIVSSIMVGAACDNFVPFEEDRIQFETPFDVFRSCVAIVGFLLMCGVFLMNVVATMVFGVQFYYVYRLMTANAIGFESSKEFYLDPEMCRWRHMSVKGLIWGMPLFVLSVGCMLSIKAEGSEQFKKIFSSVVLVIFFVFACLVGRISHFHETLFRRKYRIGQDGLHQTLMHVNQAH
jgi:hypothetical protein